ncbi:hypothetical protein OIE67_26410 [Nonomuraea fuscirosea]|uniref:hypothetical protein n=1 Tax=Nonomuraea fuscirosea TaxID=1291556 RepID=UPI002DDC2CE4|nr:hypothetical protein [Nonomuraea fuscirosea]WSA58029.1 hypothetical protein OIE67_26410 [Nonomuraea fuscirosea]
MTTTTVPDFSIAARSPAFPRQALRERLAGRRLDLLFVNAAIDRGDLTIDEVPADMFTEVMITNTLGPLRAQCPGRRGRPRSAGRRSRAAVPGSPRRARPLVIAPATGP